MLVLLVEVAQRPLGRLAAARLLGQRRQGQPEPQELPDDADPPVGQRPLDRLAVGERHLPLPFLRRQRQLLPLGLDQLAEIRVVASSRRSCAGGIAADAAARTTRCPRASHCAAIQRWRSVGGLSAASGTHIEMLYR